MNLIDDPRSAGILGLGLRLMSTPGKLGPALGTAGLGAMGDMRQAQQMQEMKAQRALQQQMLQEQLAAIQRQQEERQQAQQRQQGIEGAYRGAFRSPQQQAMAGGGGPTVANAERAQTMQPMIDQQALIAELMKVDPVAAYQMAQPKPDELMSVAPGASVINKRDPGKPVFTAPERAKETNYNDLVIPGPDGKPMINQMALSAKRELARAGATNVRVDNRPLLTKGQEKVDTEFGQVYADFIASGGVADVTKQLQQLRQASAALAKDNSLTGPIRGQLPDVVRSITNPKAVATKNAVEEVVQRNLRVVLGAQFTEKEGERLIARAYNEMLMPEENKRRVDRLIQQIESAAAAKIDAARYYEQNGSLLGWRGKLPTIRDIEAGLDGAPAAPSIDDLLNKYGN